MNNKKTSKFKEDGFEHYTTTIDMIEKTEKEKSDFSNVEYVHVDYENKKIMCVRNVSKKVGEYGGESTVIDYTKEIYEEILYRMKKIVVAEKLKKLEKDTVTESIAVKYKKEKEYRYFETKCLRTLRNISKRQKEIIEAINKKRLKKIGINLGVFGATALFAVTAIALFKDKKEGQIYIPPTSEPEQNAPVTPEKTPKEENLTKDLIDKTNDLYEEIAYKQNIIIEKDVLINLIKSLNNEYDFVKYDEENLTYLDENEKQQMVGKILNVIALIKDNNIKNVANFVGLSPYFINQNDKEMVKKSEENVKILIEKENNDNYEEIRNEYLKQSINIIISDTYTKVLGVGAKFAISSDIDQATASKFTGIERYEDDNEKPHFYLYFINEGTAFVPIRFDKYEGLQFYSLDGIKADNEQLQYYEKRGEHSYINENHRNAVNNFQNSICQQRILN